MRTFSVGNKDILGGKRDILRGKPIPQSLDFTGFVGGAIFLTIFNYTNYTNRRPAHPCRGGALL